MSARVDCYSYSRGEPVRVIAPMPGDTHRAHVGTVDPTYADAGGMQHRVVSADGQMADYYVDELKSTRAWSPIGPQRDYRTHTPRTGFMRWHARRSA